MAAGQPFHRFFGKYGLLYRDLRRVENKLDNVLLYVDFYENDHELPVILQKDGSLISLFELEGIDYESLSVEAREQMSYYLRNAFEQFDPGIVISNYLIRQRARIPRLDVPPGAPDIIHYMQKQKQRYWQALQADSFENRTVCCIEVKGRQASRPASLRQGISEISYSNFLRAEIDEKVERLYESQLKLKSSLARFRFKTLAREEIFTVLYEMINMDEAPAYRPDLSLNAQLARSRFVFDRGRLTVNERFWAAAINIKYPPAGTWAMYLGRFYGLQVPFVLKQIFEPFQYEGFEKKINFYQNIALSLSHFDKGCQHYVQDVADFKEKVTGERQSCMYWNLTFYPYANDGQDLTEQIYGIKNILKEIGSSGLDEVENLKFSYFSLFPGHERLNKRNREAVVLSANAGDLFSAFVLDRGDALPVDYFLDRTNGIFCWNPFTSRENAWHMAITGPTGQGKSFFANRMILSSLVYRPFVYIIDLSRSFRELFDLLRDEIGEETTILSFARDRVEFSMNPFLIDPQERISEEQLSFCEGLVSLMCGPEVVHDANKIVIRESLEQFFEEYQSLCRNSSGGSVPPLDVLIPILEQRSPSDAIANKMKLWTYGNKGRLINSGVDNLKLARFCYFDIEKIDRGSEELNLIVYCLFAKIMKDISLEANRNVKKFLVLDEAHHYLNIPEFEYHIDRLIRTGRHFNLLMAIITQSINDLVSDREWSKGIVNNLKQAFFFGGQKNVAAAFRMMQMDEYHTEMYDHLNIARREVLYWTSGGIRRVLRPMTDNFTYWLATTHPSERYYRKWIREKFCGGDIKKTIDTIIGVVAGSTSQEEKECKLKKFCAGDAPAEACVRSSMERGEYHHEAR